MGIIDRIWILILIVFGIILLYPVGIRVLDWLLENEEIFACLIYIILHIILIAAGVVIGILIFRSCF